MPKRHRGGTAHCNRGPERYRGGTAHCNGGPERYRGGTAHCNRGPERYRKDSPHCDLANPCSGSRPLFRLKSRGMHRRPHADMLSRAVSRLHPSPLQWIKPTSLERCLKVHFVVQVLKTSVSQATFTTSDRGLVKTASDLWFVVCHSPGSAARCFCCFVCKLQTIGSKILESYRQRCKGTSTLTWPCQY